MRRVWAMAAVLCAGASQSTAASSRPPVARRTRPGGLQRTRAALPGPRPPAGSPPAASPLAGGPARRVLGSHSCQLQRPGTGRLSVFEGKSRDRAALKQSTLFLRGDWLSAESHCVNGRVKGEHRVTAAVPSLHTETLQLTHLTLRNTGLAFFCLLLLSAACWPHVKRHSQPGGSFFGPLSLACWGRWT